MLRFDADPPEQVLYVLYGNTVVVSAYVLIRR